MKDLYGVLGIGRSASVDEVKKAYRRLAHEHHPDKNPGDPRAEERFKEVTQAYEVLSDDKRRRQYDQFGVVGEGAGGPGFGGAAGFGDPGGSANVNLGDMFGDIFGDLLGRSRAQKGARQRQPSGSPGSTRGKDRRVELQIDFFIAAFGGEKTVEVGKASKCQRCAGVGSKPGSAPQICRACGGSGRITIPQGAFASEQACAYCRGKGRIISDPCDVCGGDGVRERRTKLKVKIPAGADDGTTLRYAGEGDAVFAGGRAGDLMVTLRVDTHPLFSRDGADILVDYPVSITEAALGAKIAVPTIDGEVTMKLPAGTQSGRVFRLRGKGVSKLSGDKSRGDQHLTVVVETPVELGDDQRQLLEQLSDALGPANAPRRAILAKLAGFEKTSGEQ